MRPLAGDEETQIMDSPPPSEPEDTITTDETQLMEEEWVYSQAVDDLEETQVVVDVVQEAELEKKRDVLADDGGPIRDFATIRIESMRHWGLIAARKINANLTDVEPKYSSSNAEKSQDNGIDAHPSTKACEILEMPTSRSNLIVLGSRLDEISKELEIEDSNECMQDSHRDEKKTTKHNPTARKLLFGQTSVVNDETAIKPNSVIGKVDSTCPFVSDYAVAGLSYIASQEPGDLSQANALDVVDKFISVNDLGLPEETNIGKTDVVKSAPISSVKGVRTLAKKVDRLSPVGKAGIFEWIDSQEDGGGGEFFTKMKESFFHYKEAAQQSCTEPPKSNKVSYRIAKSGKKCSNTPKWHNLSSLACSDSRVVLRSSIRNEKVHVSCTKTKKNLFKDLNEQTNSLHLEQQLEVTGTKKDGEGTDEVGQDTQMVAEAMVTPVNEYPINYENLCEDAAMKITSSKRTSVITSTSSSPDTKTACEGVSTRFKRRILPPVSSTGSLGFSRSKKQKGNSLDCAKGKAKGEKEKEEEEAHLNYRGSVDKIEPYVPLNGAINKKVDSCHNSRTMNAHLSLSKEHAFHEFHVSSTPVALRTRYSLAVKSSKQNEALASSARDASGSSGLRTQTTIPISCTPVARRTRHSIVVKSSKQNEALASSVRDASGSVGVRTRRASAISSTPVAHRTRHTTAVKSSKHDETLASSARYASGLIGVRTRRTIAREDNLAADTTETLKMKRKCYDTESDQVAIVESIERLHDEKPKARSHVEDTSMHPKRRRTIEIDSRNPDINDDMNNSSLSVDEIQLNTQHGQIKTTHRGASEIPDTAKRKNGSASAHLASEIDGMPFNDKKKRMTSQSSVTRSSLKSLAKTKLGKCSNEKYLAKPVLYKAGSTNAANPCSTPVISLSENEGDKSKPEVSPKADLQSSTLTCTPPLEDINVASPVCVAHDHPRTFDSKGRCSSSISRELKRLEAYDALPISILKTRRRKDMTSIRILFSHHLDDKIIKQQKKVMGRLGISLASSISDATHFVADKFVRTRNMLQAMSMGRPVVTHMWLESCGETGCFMDEKNYILRDAKKEKEIGFSMPVSLGRACQRPLLQGKRVYITSSTKPDRDILLSLVKACNGQPIERIGRSALKDDKVPNDLLVLSCEEDYTVCTPLLVKGAEIFSSELLLNGIVIQKLEYERHKLFSDRVRVTRSAVYLREKGWPQVPSCEKRAWFPLIS